MSGPLSNILITPSYNPPQDLEAPRPFFFFTLSSLCPKNLHAQLAEQHGSANATPAQVTSASHLIQMNTV